MSVIFQDPDDGKIVLRCKGADSVITDRLDKDPKLIETRVANTRFVNNVAEEGLRTLFLAEKVLT